MQTQIPLERDAIAPEHHHDGVHEVLPDVAYQHHMIVNTVFCGYPQAGDRRWLLIDAGIPGSAGAIQRAAERRFGEGARPYAIVLTHGHFDHVGALRTLAERWDCPVFAHELERPYLDGSQPYPPPNPMAGGLMSLLSPMLPRRPIDIRPHLETLPYDGTIPGMPGWRWLHTPGHTPGHVSLWRAEDRTLIAGDAVITTRQESAYNAMTQRPEMHGPPMYFTPDWEQARESVRLLARLEPEIIVAMHGRAMHGDVMRRALRELATRFNEIAVPRAMPVHAGMGTGERW